MKKVKETPFKLKKKTEKLLNRLCEYLLEEPKRFNLNLWGQAFDPEKYQGTALTTKPPCGAVGCIAGNICIIQGLIKPLEVLKEIEDPEYEFYYFKGNTPDLAQKELGLTERQAGSLFYLKSWNYVDSNNKVMGWPKKFEKELEQYESGTPEYAKVTVRRIKHFMKTGK